MVSLHGLRADFGKQSVSGAIHGWREGPFHKLFRSCRISALQLGSTSVVILKEGADARAERNLE